MAVEREAQRDWHRLLGLMLTDFFTGSLFTVEMERDVSQQQQLLDVVIVRKSGGRRFTDRLPDGLDDLAAHNLITFKSHRETLDDWAMKELVGHYVAYRKLVSPSPSRLLPQDHFRLHAVCARFPHNLSGQVPWQQRQAGVYDCRWGTDEVPVIVAKELPREPHNAPLHFLSGSPELISYARSVYQLRSEHTSGILQQLFRRYEEEGLVMSYTMQDFVRDYIKEHLPELSPEERRKILQSLPPVERRQMLESLPPEERLAGLSAEQIRQYLDQLTAGRPAPPRKPRRKK